MTEIFSKGNFRRTVKRILVLPMAILALCSAVLIFLGAHVSNTLRWDRHSLEVMNSVRVVEKLLIDLETGIRGYQITAEQSFLEPYRTAWPQVGRAIADVARLVADNPEQQRRLHVLQRDVDLWNDFAAEAQTRARTSGAGEIAFNQAGKEQMDRVRADLAAFITAEQELSWRREALVEPTKRAAIVTAGGLLLAFVGFFSFWTRSQVFALVRSYERTVDEIQEQKEWFRVTLASIGDAVIVSDHENCISFMNAEAERLTGWKGAEAARRSLREIFQIVNEETRCPVEDPVDKVRRVGHVVGLANHTVLLSRQGAEFPIEDSAAPIHGAGGGIIGVVLVFRDATEQRRSRQAIGQARDQAVAASQAKDDFLAALSHELRTPLNPVLLLASEGAANGRLPAEVRADFEVISKNIRFEARLIDDLLDLTRITRGKLSLKMESIDLRALLVDVMATVKTEWEAKGIAFSLAYGLAEAPIRGDPARLQQVFLNLLRNAIKFTPPGGSIRVEAGPAGRAAKVCVSDSGIGLTEAEIGRVFQAFAQGDHADGSGFHRFGGLGLGLTIARVLVELHAGTIEVASAGRDRGAAFTVTLPFAEAATGAGLGAVTAAPAARREPARARLPILLVEDHAATRAALARLLLARNYAVTEAGSVSEALGAAAATKFALVISDIGLPDGDGYGLMEQLRDRHGLPGIALTGYGMAADIDRARASGFVDHLTKPIGVETLDAALAAARRVP